MMRGFVLLIMLVYMQLFSLLAMHGVSALTGEKKMIIHRMDNNDKRQLMLSVMAQYVDRLAQPACIIHRSQSDVMLRHNLPWWRMNGCHYMQAQHAFFFVREMLETDTCAVMTNEYNQAVMPVYYRNTLLYLSGVSIFDALILQDTIALPGKLPPTCTSTPKTVKPGRQMLRWL